MKRLLTALFTALLLTAALCVSASAADFQAVAEDLSSIGMFRGTAGGDFALDRAPTRSEAAIMLVRLYGAEQEAAEQYAAGTISHPFTDVSGTAAPYVAWLRTHGIANGVTDTAFGSSRACTAQNYVVFLLRALGYQDGKDFQYNDAISFAVGKGLFDMSMFSGAFLRDDLAAVTYQALACELKDGSTYLLDSLVKSGAIDASAAKPITDKIETYRALLSASAALGNALDVSFTAKANAAVSVDGTVDGEKMQQSMTLPISYSGKIQMVLDSKPQMAVTMRGSAMGSDLDMGCWLKDGWLYVQSGDESFKVDLGDQLDEALGAYRQLMDVSGQLSAAMLPYIDTLTANRSGGNTTYTLTLNNDAVSGLVDDVVALVLTATGDAGLELDLDMDVTLGNCSYSYTVGSNGQLKQVAANLDMEMGMDVAQDAQNQMAVKVGLEIEMDMTVHASGKAVKVSYPSNLSKFPAVIGGAVGSLA